MTNNREKEKYPEKKAEAGRLPQREEEEGNPNAADAEASRG